MAGISIKAKIMGSGSYFPSAREDIEDFVKKGASKDNVVKFGVLEHRVMGIDETITDMEVNAAKTAIKNAGIKPEDIDLIISSSAVPKQIGVPNSNAIQKAIGAKNAGAFDIVMACASAIPQMLTAASFIASNQFRHVLLTASSHVTNVSDPTDPASFVVLGDGASAIVMGHSDGESGIISSGIKTNGEYFDYCGFKIKRPKKDESRLHPEKLYFYIGDLEDKSSDVLEYILSSVPEIVRETLAKTSLTVQDIDFFVFHQNTSILVDNWIRALGIPPEKTLLTYPECGNMTNANIFAVIDKAFSMGKIKDGDKIVFAGQGAGFSVGSIVMRW